MAVGFQPGEGWMLLAALAMAVGTVLIRYAARYSDPVATTGWHMLIGGCLFWQAPCCNGALNFLHERR